MDAVLPWRFEEPIPLPLPIPPPVPPKNDLRLKVRSATAASISAERIPIPERVTPWLLRRVKTPVTQAPPHPAPQKASTTDNYIRGSPKPEPPAYHAVPQQQIYPSQESLAISSRTRNRTRGPAAVVHSQSSQSAIRVQVEPRSISTPPTKPPAVTHRSTSARGGGEETQRVPTPTPHSGCPQLRSVRSAPQEERSRRSGPRGATRAPLRPVAVQHEQRVLLPSYHSAEPLPFPSPGSAPPPYRVSAAEDSYPTSARSRSLPRSSRKHGGSTFEKEKTTPLPPLPPLPPPLSHPQLSSSAISRIQAGHKVSKEFGDAIMKQELRLATPTSDHHSSGGLDPVPNPRLGRRFLSTSELQSHRKAKLHTDKIAPEHEARLRTYNKSSSNVARCSGDSRQRTVSAHPGRGHDKVSQRGRR